MWTFIGQSLFFVLGSAINKEQVSNIFVLLVIKQEVYMHQYNESLTDFYCRRIPFLFSNYLY